MNIKTLKITISGTVQGIGFRPYIFNIAVKYNIRGFVSNDSDKIIITAQSPIKNIKCFIYDLKHNKPENASYQSFKILKIKNPDYYHSFKIIDSIISEKKNLSIPPDLPVCDKCLKEIFDKNSRKYYYPYVSCTECGPRYTVTENIPYDRKNTVLKTYTMCRKCMKEYTDAANRRFHSQNNICFDCGPYIVLYNNNKKMLFKSNTLNNTKKMFQFIAEKINEGRILALKGIGGYHIACDATNSDTVKTLRIRKKRPHKAFAVMIKNTDEIKKYALISNKEKKTMQEKDRSIIILKKKINIKTKLKITEEAAPGSQTIGIMLPYTPVQYLLFDNIDKPLIMTSANVSSDPIITDDKKALNELNKICDYILTGSRDILINCDDSVLRIFKNKKYVYRRSRGYTPLPFYFKKQNSKKILSLGAESGNSICILNGKSAILSNYIGDLKSFQSFINFKKTIRHFLSVYGFKPEIIAFDMHTQYISSQFAQYIPDEFHDLKNALKFQVQHHHAHAAGCLAENNVNDKAIAVILDGTGFGTDGTIWGGEILIADKKEFTRAGHIKNFILPGMDSPVKYPWKTALSMIYHIKKDRYMDFIPDNFKNIDIKEMEMIIYQLKNSLNTAHTSSCGRLFDAVSSLCGLCFNSTFDGQPALMLENIINVKTKDRYVINIKTNTGLPVLDWDNMICQILNDLRINTDVSVISGKFHLGLIYGLYEICLLLKKQTGISKIALSGGCFMNMYLLKNLFNLLNKNGFKVYTNSIIPCNDNGISFGQAVIAENNS